MQYFLAHAHRSFGQAQSRIFSKNNKNKKKTAKDYKKQIQSIKNFLAHYFLAYAHLRSRSRRGPPILRTLLRV